ncbi:coiled-coil domain-containing protein 34-like [Teleopsis dalmanni]|uniref:coiled-coil domain-containing protein 34-like n=1 Tax=Teleopsis dalmanni TaxID=139649 RepID=UPI0018CFE0FE|nr:coiled-coil domain-containing protein 34-like [Teleopsis dalmanni]XP_037949093.1 coiled-coil domain-containing protein 34-like [Teleopsis dalmanni]
MTTSSGSAYSLSLSPECASNASSDSRRSIRYINSAAYIEKNVDDSSMEFSDHYMRSSQSQDLLEERSDIVPPLDLQSIDGISAHEPGYTYQRYYEILPLRADPDLAFKTWLSAKKKIKSEEEARRKREEDNKKENEELRKRESELRFQMWLQEKSRKKSEEKLNKKTPSNTSSTIKTKAAVDPEKTKVKLLQWEENKRIQYEKKRKEQLDIDRRKREAESLRQENATRAWEEWLKKAPKKPKPVPLNRGLQTLQGTVSELYVNPIQWQD